MSINNEDLASTFIEFFPLDREYCWKTQRWFDTYSSVTDSDISAKLGPACRGFLCGRGYATRVRELFSQRDFVHMFEIIPSQRYIFDCVEDYLYDNEDEFRDVVLTLMLSGSAGSQISYAKFQRFYKNLLSPEANFDFVKLAQRTLMYSLVDLMDKDRSEAATLACELRKRSFALRDFHSFNVTSNDNDRSSKDLLKQIFQDLIFLSRLLGVMGDLGNSDTWKVSMTDGVVELLTYLGSDLHKLNDKLSSVSEGFYSRLSYESPLKRNYALAHFSYLVHSKVTPISSLDFETCLCYTCDASRFLDVSGDIIPITNLRQSIHNGAVRLIISRISNSVDSKSVSIKDPILATVFIMCHELNSLNFSSLAYSIVNKFDYRKYDQMILFDLKLDIYLSGKELSEALRLCKGKTLEDMSVC